MLESSRASARSVGRIIAIGTVGLFALAGSHLQRVIDEGLSQRSLVWGTNHLVRRGLLVDIARDGLREHLSEAPRHAVIILEGIDLEAIHRANGPRVWLASPLLQVYDASVLRRDDRCFHLAADGTNLPIALARDRLYLFRRSGDRLEPLDVDSWQEPGRRR